MLASVAVPAAGGVTTLTRASWDETLAEHSAVLVYFYTPSCKHCREFKPKFKEAAAALAAEANLFIAQARSHLYFTGFSHLCAPDCS